MCDGGIKRRIKVGPEAIVIRSVLDIAYKQLFSQRTQSLITGDYQLPALTCFLGRSSFLGARRTILWPEAI